MTTTHNKPKINRLVASIAACVLIAGGGAAAYAADFVGIQRALQLWIHGNLTDVTIQFDGNGNYSLEYTDDEGDSKRQGGGGAAFDENGNERPLTEDEILEHLNGPEVSYAEDGSVWIWYFDKKIDITDRFEDGVCYAEVSNGEETLYMTIRYQNGLSVSHRKYLVP